MFSDVLSGWWKRQMGFDFCFTGKNAQILCFFFFVWNETPGKRQPAICGQGACRRVRPQPGFLLCLV